MQEVGVEAVVSGLSSFLGDMDKMDDKIRGLVPSAGLLERAFDGIGSVVDGLVGGAFRVLEYTLGNLISDSIQWFIDKVNELITSTVEAGTEFQTLELRLNRLNFNDKFEELGDYNQAQAQAVELTKEQLTWLSRLATATPYDNTDIANVYTLARSYNFMDEEARGLVETITNFASGMGLGNTEIRRIIVNLGQMTQTGKVTQRELNDLARGAFVPINDILQIMQQETGKTGAEFDEFRNSAEGVDSFLRAFTTLVETRFKGAAQDMAQTFQGATANAQDFIKSLFGMNVIKPLLDVIGEKIATFVNALTTEANWERATSATQRIGDALSNIVRALFSLGPSPVTFADIIITKLEDLATWLEEHRQDIINWLFDAVTYIKTEVIPTIIEFRDWLFGTSESEGAIQQFGNWLKDVLIPKIMEAADWVGNVLVPFLRNDLYPIFLALIPLGSALADVLLAAMGVEPNTTLSSWIHDVLIPAIEKATQWVIENKDEIAIWLQRLAELAIFLEIAGWILGAVVSIVAMVAKVFIAIGVFQILMQNIIILGSVIRGLVGWFNFLKDQALRVVEYIIDYFSLLGSTFSEIGERVQDALMSGNWWDAGAAIVEGLANGIYSNAFLVYDALTDMAHRALDAVYSIFNIGSPSKVMDDIGGFVMEGFARGILSSTNMAVAAMQGAMAQTIMPAVAAPQVVQSAAAGGGDVTNNNMNLTVNSNANTEPIIQDFNMLQSLLVE